MMFRGVNSLSLDAKGRLAIPTKYREALQRQSEGRMIVTVNHVERCLWLYPLPEWEDVERKLVKLPSVDKAAQRLKHLLIGHASDVDLDANGRLLVPSPLRAFADIEKRAALIGQGNKFEIWNEDTWHTRREEWLSQVEETGPLSVELESLSL